MRGNAVAYYPAPQSTPRRRGRPRLYGQQVRLRELWQSHYRQFHAAHSPVYGESQVLVRYYALDLL